MVYVQPSLLGWRPLVQSWTETLPEGYTPKHCGAIIELCNWLLPPVLRLLTKFLDQPVNQQEQIIVTSLLRIVEAELQPLLGVEAGKALALKTLDVDAAVQNVFLFALVWSAGASVNEAGRDEFDAQLRLYFDEKCDSSHFCLRVVQCHSCGPEAYNAIAQSVVKACVCAGLVRP